jgi:hypothetical protein
MGTVFSPELRPEGQSGVAQRLRCFVAAAVGHVNRLPELDDCLRGYPGEHTSDLHNAPASAPWRRDTALSEGRRDAAHREAGRLKLADHRRHVGSASVGLSDPSRDRDPSSLDRDLARKTEYNYSTLSARSSCTASPTATCGRRPPAFQKML